MRPALQGGGAFERFVDGILAPCLGNVHVLELSMARGPVVCT